MQLTFDPKRETDVLVRLIFQIRGQLGLIEGIHLRRDGAIELHLIGYRLEHAVAIHVLERFPCGAPLGPCELESKARLEGFDHLLAVRNRDRRFGGDPGTQQREGGLQLEQLGESHPAAGLAPLCLALGNRSFPTANPSSRSLHA